MNLYNNSAPDKLKNKLPQPEVTTIEKQRADKGKKRQKYDSNLPEKYKRYLYSANKRSLTFNLTTEQFNSITALNCVYCGSSSKVGIDRINNSIGYEIDNCQPCCTNCNMMKFKYSNDEFLKHIIKIVKHLNLI